MESGASIESARKEANLRKKKLICETACCKNQEETNTYLKHYISCFFCASFCICLFEQCIKNA